MKTVPNPYRAGGCFFCGPSNPQGLKLTFQETETEPNELVCQWVPASMYKGFGKILHGGIQSGLFDEIMGWTTLHLTQQVAVTSALKVNFLKPLYVEQPIEVRCRIQSREGAKSQSGSRNHQQPGGNLHQGHWHLRNHGPRTGSTWQWGTSKPQNGWGLMACERTSIRRIV